MIGKQFGKLTVVERDNTKPKGHGIKPYWMCKCSCGNKKKVSIRADHLRLGKTKSCGCILGNNDKQQNAKKNNKIVKNYGQYSKVSLNSIETLIDNENLPKVLPYNWNLSTSGYLCKTSLDKPTIWLHRLLANTSKDIKTDHVNHNKLDNRRANLRNATNSQNSQNSIGRNNKWGHKGIYKNGNKFYASLQCEHKKYHSKGFNTPKEAHMEYRKMADEHFKEFACYS